MALQHIASGLLLMTAGGALADECCCGGTDCSWSLSPPSLIFDCNAQAGAFNVVVPTGTDCGWDASVTSGGSFLSINSGSSGNASGTIGIDLLANADPERTGQITVVTTVVSPLGPIGTVIGVFDVTQAECVGDSPPQGELPPGGFCSWNISPNAGVYTCYLQAGFFNVITNTGCGWEATVISGGSFITITSGSTGNDTGTVHFDIGFNPGSNRGGQIQVVTTVVSALGPIGTVIGFYNIAQTECGGGGGAPCSWDVYPLSFWAFPVCELDTGQSQVTTGAGCSWEATVLTGGTYITITSGSTGLASGTIVYDIAANTTGVFRIGKIEVRTLTASVFGPIGTLINTITIYQDTCPPVVCPEGLADTYSIVGYFDCLIPECAACPLPPVGEVPTFDGVFHLVNPCVWWSFPDSAVGYLMCGRHFNPLPFQLTLDAGNSWTLQATCTNPFPITVWFGKKTYGNTPQGVYTFDSGCAGGPEFITII